MIRCDIDASNEILRKINKNIYCMIELFEETCKGLDYECILEEIFPIHYVRKNKEKCIEMIKELREYTIDSYLHYLNPIQEFALFHLIEWWLDVSEYDFDEVVEENIIKTDEDRYFAEHINNIEEYKSFLFYDWDFLEEFLSIELERYKEYGPAYEKLNGINLEDYLEILPDDKKNEYFEVRKKFELINIFEEEENNKELLMEKLIVNQIFNAIKVREKNPKRLKSTSETQLSDDITDIVREKLHDNELIIAREMPCGFSKVGIGECDFYIYTYEGGIYKVLAIGENKEWGNYENQLKQLIGYMTKDVKFGFTILFNKNVNLKTILQKRIEILKNFHIEKDGEKHFRVVNEISELKNMNDVLLTWHENPEKKDTYFRIYHFIINANLKEREESAVQARK